MVWTIWEKLHYDLGSMEGKILLTFELFLPCISKFNKWLATSLETLWATYWAYICSSNNGNEKVS